MRLGIIGGGRAAWALGSAWQLAGKPLAGISTRPGGSDRVAALLETSALELPEIPADCDLLAIAVSDRSIGEVGAMLPFEPERQARFHLSGSLPSDVLGMRPLRFALHPFRSLPPVGSAVTLRGALMAFEGTAEAFPVAQHICKTVGATFAEIAKESKTVYHAAAVFAANDVAAVCNLAFRLLEEIGVDSVERRHVAELAISAIENWQGEGEDRFTGPVARRDLTTIRAELDALDPERRALYRLLAREIARETSAGDELLVLLGD